MDGGKQHLPPECDVRRYIHKFIFNSIVNHGNQQKSRYGVNGTQESAESGKSSQKCSHYDGLWKYISVDMEIYH